MEEKLEKYKTQNTKKKNKADYKNQSKVRMTKYISHKDRKCIM